MKNITDREIYQAAWALLAKYKNDEWKAIDFLQAQMWKHSHPKNADVFDTTLRIQEAIKELVDLSSKGNTVH